MWRLCVGVIFCILLILLSSESATASSVWSWFDGDPVVSKNDRVSMSLHPTCPTYKVEISVKGIASPLEACMFSGATFELVTVFIGGTIPRAAIKYRSDESFRLVDSLCAGAYLCLYSAESDSLFVQRGGAAEVYRKVSQRLRREIDPITGEVRDLFTASEPDYVIGNGAGTGQRIGSAAFSANGEWLVYEIKDFGIARLHISSGERRRLLVSSGEYGYGRDPLKELAASNNGTYVAVMGENTGSVLIEVTAACGEVAIGGVTQFRDYPVQWCRTRDIATAGLTNSFYYASRPRFGDTGGQLTFFTRSFTEGLRRIILQAPGHSSIPDIDYISLGDSFTSGEGETSDDYYIEGTNTHSEKCHLSRRAYPFLIGIYMNIPSAKVKSVACSGAKTVDIVSVGNSYFGQGERLRTVFTENELAAVKGDTLESFLPGRIPQAAFINRYQPRIATIGIGGNDAGFMTKLKTCAMPGTCRWAQNPDLLAKTYHEIGSLEQVLVSIYTSLRAESPNTIFFAVGYPDIITLDDTCDSLTSLLLDKKERRFLQEGVSYINTVIRRSAKKAGIHYLDIEKSLFGARLCESNGVMAVNGLRAGDDISLVSQLPMLRMIGNETFHPTPYGHERIAKWIDDSYGDLRTYSCVLCGSNAEGVSEYWGVDTTSQETMGKLQRVDFAEEKSITVTHDTLEMVFEQTSFLPHTPVEFRVNGSEDILAIALSDERGGLRTTLTFQQILNNGFYTLHATGLSFSALPTEYYQPITFGSVVAQMSMAKDTNTTPMLPVDKNATYTVTLNSIPSTPYSVVLGIQDNSPHIPRGDASNEPNKDIGVLVGVATGLAVMLLVIYGYRQIKNTSQDEGG